MKGLCVLGSTGSVGTNTLRVVETLGERFRVVSMAAGRNLNLLAQQVVKFRPLGVCVGSGESVQPLRERLSALGYCQPVEIVSGTEGQVAVATLPEVDFVVSASHGITGLKATYEAVRAGKAMGLANKETLVVAGELVTQAARQSNAEILPIDSEHSAVHQCLRSGRSCEVRRLILTGSGGPFRKTPRRQLATVTPEQALKHPVWRMGARITVDSATLMNKGLEIIEAHWLFDLASEQIAVLIHPESVVHSMVEFKDGFVVAQLSVADMRLPIQYALTYPERIEMNGDGLGLNLVETRRLRFEEPDRERFPCLALGREALEKGGAMPCVLNASDEVAVQAFLERRLPFVGIPKVIEQAMKQTPSVSLDSLEAVLECDREARQRAREAVTRIQSTGD